MAESRHNNPSVVPWTRGLFGLAVAGPAIAIGGVHPWVLCAWLVLVAALLWRVTRRAKSHLLCPWPALVLLGLAVWTAVPAVPGLASLVAPELEAWIREALRTTPVDPPATISVRPADTLLEVVRLLGLAALTLAAAQLSWKLAAAAVTASGLAVAGVGFVHAFFDATKIFGLYAPRDANLETRTAFLGTFVNPNHQSGLLLLAIFCGAALAFDQLVGSRTARDATKAEQRRDRGLAMLGAIALLLPALLLSLSRGALLAFALTSPVAIVVALRQLPLGQRSAVRSSRRGPLLLALLAVAGLIVAVGRHGAWVELATLFDDPSTAFDEKLGPAVEALALVEYSPIFGTGRGTFIDLFALHAPAPNQVYTHLESVPITAWVEWGPLVGAVVILAGIVWWVRAVRNAGPRRERKARTLVLLGIAALALQSIVDFSLEFIGVTAPLLALVGALTPHGDRRLNLRWVRRLGPPLVLVGATAVPALAPHSWADGRFTDADVSTGRADLTRALWWRPIDGGLHAVAARSALDRDDDAAATAHARFATRARPSSVDAWLMLSEVLARRGERAASDWAYARGLDRVRAPVPTPLVEHLLRRTPRPEDAEALAPSRRRAFSAIVRALRDVGAVEHADAMARARVHSHPDDPTPLLVRSQLAAERRNPALAFHFASLARATAPDSGDAHLAVVRATVMRDGVSAGLEALDAIPFTELSSRERDRADELRVRLLIQSGKPDALRRARSLADELLLHSRDDATRSRRRALARAAADASP